MKAPFWLGAALVLGYAIADGAQTSDRDVLLITGSLNGHLSPCGCTKPMSGGLRRRITAIKLQTSQGRTTVIETGGMVEKNGRQDEMKAEAVAEAMKLVKVAAINYGLEEARLGAGMAASLDRLSGGALVASGLGESELGLDRFKRSGRFLIGGVDTRVADLGAALRTRPQAVDGSVAALVEEAKATGLAPVLMARCDLEAAKAIAASHPGLALVVCTLKSSPLAAPERVGKTLIVGAGESGKYLVRIEWDGKVFSGYKFFDLGPEYEDDKDAQAVYTTYLQRVGRENLLAMEPRSATPQFAGNKLCGSCHAKANKVWKESAHSHALKTLEGEGHDRDPDCVRCHVVGLSSTVGFTDRKATPLLSDVGCEACHGPGRDHAMNPYKHKMGDVGREACIKCHTPENSPGFDFEKYWAKIKH